MGVCVWFDRHWRGDGLGDGEPGSDEGVRWDDHLIAGTDAIAEQDEPQCIEAVADTDGVIDVAIGRELLLEGGDLRAEYELARCHDAADGSVELVSELGVRSREV